MSETKDFYGRDEFEALELEEREHLEVGANDSWLAGLAISGGGIRSASFGLGVLQGLVRDGYLSRFHYLSTVSGGGYIGSSLTWFLHRGLPNADGEDRDAGVMPHNFPFGQAIPGRDPGGDEGNAILDYMRQHGNYLIPGGGLGATSMVAVVIRAVVMSLFIYGGLLVGLMSVGLNVHELLERVPAFASLFGDRASKGAPLLGLSLVLLVVFIVASLLFSIIHGLLIRIVGAPVGSYGMRTWSQRMAGLLVNVALFSALLGVIPLIYAKLPMLGVGKIEEAWKLAAGISGAAMALGSILGVKQARDEYEGNGSGLQATLIIYAATSLVLLGLLLGSWAITFELHESGQLFWVPWVILGAAVVAGWFININYLSLHRMYRDRLMETFMPNLESVRAQQWAAASDADRLEIKDICHQPNRQPYHLVNANIVLVDSDEAKYRSRGGDNFVMSRLFSGSSATGWRRSKDWQVSAARSMTLASAMAISGAAANPNTGLAGGGFMRSRVASTLMSLLNIRLGYWAPNPNPQLGDRTPNPNYMIPGVAAVLGLGLHERRPIVELTDGGHFENLAIYELIRRRLDLVVVCDGGADGSFEFGDFSNAVERVRVDFGVKIELSEDERSRLMPTQEPEQPIDPEGKLKLAERGYAVGTIRYPGGKVGTLVLIKTTMVAGLPPDLYSYKRAHPAFPDETTADQFFDEKQFEAYRELGYTIAKQFGRDEATDKYFEAK